MDDHQLLGLLRLTNLPLNQANVRFVENELSRSVLVASVGEGSFAPMLKDLIYAFARAPAKDVVANLDFGETTVTFPPFEERAKLTEDQILSFIMEHRGKKTIWRAPKPQSVVEIVLRRSGP